MKCIKCQKDAQAVCKFCGRAVCSEHIHEQRYPTGFATRLAFWTAQKNGVVVPDAVWCGSCHPEFFGTA